MLIIEPHPPKHKLLTNLAGFGLSEREQDVSILAMQGFSNSEIAEQLFIAEQTVKDHLHHIFEKMNIRRRGELVAKALGFSFLNKLS